MSSQPGTLTSHTVAISDPGALIDVLPSGDVMTWVRRGDGLVAWGEVCRWEYTSPDQIAEADQAWRDLVSSAHITDDVSRPGSGPVAFVSFAFASAGAARGTAGEGPGDAGNARGVLVVPSVVIGLRSGQWWLTQMSVDGEPKINAHDMVTKINKQSAPRPPGAISYTDSNECRARWKKAVQTAVDRITNGDIDKVVLAREIFARTSEPIDPRWLLRRLEVAYPACWTFCVDGLVGATPELLVRRERGLITSRVLAGTIRRSGDDDGDLALAASLARSSKDLEEHDYAVASVAHALESFWAGANVPESPYVLHLPNVMHLATDVTGVASSSRDASVLELAAALHPTAAVCGTPTRQAADLISELEDLDRSRYTGPVGWVDAAGDGELGIALRCAELNPADEHMARLFAGCGIVAGSDPDAELAESDAKLIPMRDALGPA